MLTREPEPVRAVTPARTAQALALRARRRLHRRRGRTGRSLEHAAQQWGPAPAPAQRGRRSLPARGCSPRWISRRSCTSAIPPGEEDIEDASEGERGRAGHPFGRNGCGCTGERTGARLDSSALVLGACGCTAGHPARQAAHASPSPVRPRRMAMQGSRCHRYDPKTQAAVELRTGLEEFFGQDVFVGIRVTRSRLRGDPDFTQAAVGALSRNSDDLTKLFTPGVRQRQGEAVPSALGVEAGGAGRVRPGGQPARPGRQGHRPPSSTPFPGGSRSSCTTSPRERSPRATVRSQLGTHIDDLSDSPTPTPRVTTRRLTGSSGRTTSASSRSARHRRGDRGGPGRAPSGQLRQPAHAAAVGARRAARRAHAARRRRDGSRPAGRSGVQGRRGAGERRTPSSWRGRSGSCSGRRAGLKFTSVWGDHVDALVSLLRGGRDQGPEGQGSGPGSAGRVRKAPEHLPEHVDRWPADGARALGRAPHARP